MLYREPQLLHQLLSILAKSAALYLNAQIAAGANAVMIFDTWGGVLTTSAYHEFSLNYMREIMAQLQRQHDGQKIPVILFTKGGNVWLESIAESGCDAMGVDWSINLNVARHRVGDKVALQGNLDPSILYAQPEKIQQEVHTLLESYGQGNGHVFNLGHGIHQDIPPEHVQVLIDTVHEASKKYHSG
jgi:uroporphyrinogen decarboxylase